MSGILWDLEVLTHQKIVKILTANGYTNQPTAAPHDLANLYNSYNLSRLNVCIITNIMYEMDKNK